MALHDSSGPETGVLLCVQTRPPLPTGAASWPGAACISLQCQAPRSRKIGALKPPVFKTDSHLPEKAYWARERTQSWSHICCSKAQMGLGRVEWKCSLIFSIPHYQSRLLFDLYLSRGGGMIWIKEKTPKQRTETRKAWLRSSHWPLIPRWPVSVFSVWLCVNTCEQVVSPCGLPLGTSLPGDTHTPVTRMISDSQSLNTEK